jgi:NCS1 family nucleobase:cation symporter-1
MDGYAIWMAPIAANLICDYWIVRRQPVSVADMYRPDGVYANEKWGTN